MERPSVESLKSFSNMDPHDLFDDDADNDPLLQAHHTQTRPRGSSFKRAVSHFTRLSICLAIVGTCCIAVILLVLTVFLAFFEPCLNPVLNSTTYADVFSNVSQVNLGVTASRSLLIRPAANPAAALNRLETTIQLSATTDPALSGVTIQRAVTNSSYLLSFDRPAVPHTLERCSYEEVTLSLGTFERNLNGTFALQTGSVEVLQIQNQFTSFGVTLGSGPITITQLRCTDALSLLASSGSIKGSTLQSSLAFLSAPGGEISVNTITAEELDVISGLGVSITTLTLSTSLRKCAVAVEATATVSMSYILVSTADTCVIRVETRQGDINIALSGFSGTFSVATGKGLVNIPGFPSCDNQASCQGTANPGGSLHHQIQLTTEVGSIELVFL